MISPLASPMRGWRNLTPFRGRGRGGANPWTPAQLAPRYWLGRSGVTDGMSTWAPLIDTAGAGNATLGATTAAPVPLGWNGNPRLWLPGITGNNVTCTAPANTASYSAQPYGGGAPTTGAASAGAFTFDTAGSWSSVSLLNVGGVELARYEAGSSTQTGHTDGFGVVWTVGRLTTGPKSLVQSTTAASGYGHVVFGTNDTMTFPAAGMPPMANTDTWTVAVIARTFATVPSGPRLLDAKGSVTTTAAGLLIRYTTSTSVLSQIGDGTNGAISAAVATVDGAVNAFGASATTTQFRTRVNGAASALVNRPANSQSSAAAVQVGNINSTQFIDMALISILTFSYELTAIEWGQLAAYYGAGS